MSETAQSFPIMLGGSPAEHARRLMELEAVILDPPDSLLIKLLGSGGSHPTTALAYLDVLTLLPNSVHRAVISYSCLFGAGDLALWLEISGHRDIRPRATVYVARAAPAREVDQLSSDHVVVAPSVSWPGDNEVLCRDWDICLRLIARHVDLDSMFDRILGAGDLRELLLIDTYSIDALLTPSIHVSLPDCQNASLALGRFPDEREEKERAD